MCNIILVIMVMVILLMVMVVSLLGALIILVLGGNVSDIPNNLCNHQLYFLQS